MLRDSPSPSPSASSFPWQRMRTVPLEVPDHVLLDLVDGGKGPSRAAVGKVCRQECTDLAERGVLHVQFRVSEGARGGEEPTAAQGLHAPLQAGATATAGDKKPELGPNLWDVGDPVTYGCVTLPQESPRGAAREEMKRQVSKGQRWHHPWASLRNTREQGGGGGGGGGVPYLLGTRCLAARASRNLPRLSRSSVEETEGSSRAGTRRSSNHVFFQFRTVLRNACGWGGRAG